MNKMIDLLAKKYAVAYMNVYGQSVTAERYHHLQSIVDTLPPLETILFFLQRRIVDDSVAQNILTQIAQYCQADASFQKLIDCLFHDQRCVLLPRVVYYIIREYQQRHNLMPCTVSYAHEPTPEQKKIFEQFFSTLIDQTIEFSHDLDPSLIAGIRLQSDSIMWEYSIDKQLRTVQQISKKDPDGN